MKLSIIAMIQSGYHSRGRVEPHEDGSHFLLQARDVDGGNLTYRTDTLIRFNPDLSRADGILKKNDILFMARGTRNYSVLLGEIPDSTLAAACFFIVRISDEKVFPGYLCWYLNQPPVERYLVRHSGRGVHMPVVRRSVLEKLDIPLPTMEIQKKIVELEALRREEEDLTNRLAEKRKQQVTALCLKAIRES
ncbi:MAG: restriction endonuclease subunit S [Deltaproteobacteria bacterium]|nr:restriction endonuclease subunit S [Deltaproteobacteria bacterium]